MIEIIQMIIISILVILAIAILIKLGKVQKMMRIENGMLDDMDQIKTRQSEYSIAEILKEIEILKSNVDGMKNLSKAEIENLKDVVSGKLYTFEMLQKSSMEQLTVAIKSKIVNLQEIQIATLENLERSTKERLTAVDDKMATLSKVVSDNLKLLIHSSSENISKMESSLARSLRDLRNTVDENLKFINTENKKELEKMREIVDEKLASTLEKRLNTSFNVINNSLEQVFKGLGDVQNLSKGVGDLKKVLQNVKTRGTWAEVQLDNLLSQILTPSQYKKQAIIDKKSSERVDFGIILPGKDQEVIIPIDSKFPIEDYYRLIEATEEGDREKQDFVLKQLEKTVKLQAESISAKYIKPPFTTDFAVMYLPLEGLYAEVLRRNTLVEVLQRDLRIVIAGPSTLGAILNSLQMGFRTLEIEKRSGEIYDLLAVFKKEFVNFSDMLDKTQKKLKEASNQIELASRKTRTIGRKLKSVTSEKEDILDVEEGFSGMEMDPIKIQSEV